MARPKSLIASMEITVAGSTHGCRNNREKHRIQKGMKRLTIREDGSDQNYCLACAKGFLVKDIGRLQELLTDVEASSQLPAIVS